MVQSRVELPTRSLCPYQLFLLLIYNQALNMQKYRRFTDQKTGVNPFIKSSKSSTNFIVRALILCIKTAVFLVKFPICLILLTVKLTTVLPEALLPGIIGVSLTKIVNKALISVFLLVANVYEREDRHIDSILMKKPDIKIYLSNHCNLIDTFFYILKLSPLEVVVQIQGQHEQLSYTSVRGLSLLLAIFSKTGFYKKGKPGVSLTNIYQNSKKAGRNLLIYFEGVKTNGGGVLTIRQQLAENILDLDTSVGISCQKYACDSDQISLVTEGPFNNLFHILTVWSIKLKNKSKVLQKQESMYTKQELIDNLYEFYDICGIKKLDLVTADYYDFMEFYNQTQRSGYTKAK